jgi:release factor glutamine methyltransferase
MKIGEAETWLTGHLQTIYDRKEAANISALVMEHLTHLNRMERSLERKASLTAHQLHHLTEMTQRLKKHEPVQYVVGQAWFAGLKLYVDPTVLIPRPETEELVDWIIKDVKASGLPVFSNDGVVADKTTELKIIDVGTGSGCIALALKKAMPLAEVWGCDISEEALNVARRNGSESNIRVDFQGINFLDSAQQKFLPSVEIIVSNPPYISEKDKATIPNNVISYEPHAALFVPNNDALVFYKALAQFGKNRLHEGGSIYVEINENSAAEVVQLFIEQGYTNLEIRKDMQGKDRMVKGSYSDTN